MIKHSIKIQDDLLVIFLVYHNFMSPLDLSSYVSNIFALHIIQADPKTSLVLNLLLLVLL